MPASMDTFTLLRFAHVAGFAAWFGTVLASVAVLKTLEAKLTDTNDPAGAAEYQALLQRFIKLETKIADIGFPVTVVSGLLLAWLHHGWDAWVFTKIGLVALQVALTMTYIFRRIHGITYPATPALFQRWYRLFGISLSMFALTLLVTFFLG